jgi:uncharacterized membrane protein YeaQ/YmgE (transglycosylase-associated protein family)
VIGSIILAIIVGAVIDVVALLIMPPGKQSIGMIMTVLLGAVGPLIGAAVAGAFGYHKAKGGIAWIPFIIGVVVAIILIAI